MTHVEKMTLRSHTQAVTKDDSLEDSPQSSTWVTMKTPQDLRNGQLMTRPSA